MLIAWKGAFLLQLLSVMAAAMNEKRHITITALSPERPHTRGKLSLSLDR